MMKNQYFRRSIFDKPLALMFEFMDLKSGGSAAKKNPLMRFRPNPTRHARLVSCLICVYSGDLHDTQQVFVISCQNYEWMPGQRMSQHFIEAQYAGQLRV